MYTKILLSCLLLFFTWTNTFADTAIKELPRALPSPTLTTTSTSTSPIEANTPEYVVLKPSDQATFSSETAASVANILVKEGSTFKMGDILLQLDCRLQQAELKKSLAQQAAQKKARDAAVRLKNYGSISEFEVVKALSDEQIANAEVDKLRAVVEKCTIRAPFNGAVAELMVHAHETVKPGDPLLRIVNTDHLEFQLQVPSTWLGWLRIDTPFFVNLNEVNKKVSAKVTKINPQIDPVSQTVKIVGTVTHAETTLLPGMSGQAIFPDNPLIQKKHLKN